MAKGPGGTSHDVVNAVRRKFGIRRVGHAGTLDPLATGLLVVAVGPATRFLQYLPLEPKEYVAEIEFGKATSTYDLEGEVTSEGEVPEDLSAAIEGVLPQFLGLIQQMPPMHSAVKKNGQPLYRLARQGVTVEREPRTVHIGSFEREMLSSNAIRARIVCSGGTYIRSIAHDLGHALGCGAFLRGLIRTKVGRFDLVNAKPVDELVPEGLVPLREALRPMPIYDLNPQEAALARDGRSLILATEFEAKHVALAGPSGHVLGVARVEAKVAHPECVLPKEAGLHA